MKRLIVVFASVFGVAASRIPDSILRVLEEYMNLAGIKVAAFDFDDTLALHKYTKYKALSDNDEYYLEAYQNPEIFFKEIEVCEPNASLKKIVEYCNHNNIPMYCISGMPFSLHMEAKKTFVREHYGDNIEFIIAASQERKDDVLHILAKANNCDREEILFVDDMEDNIRRMNKLGYSAINVNDVV